MTSICAIVYLVTEIKTIMSHISRTTEEMAVIENKLEVVESRLKKYEDQMTQHIQRVNVIEEDKETFRQLKTQLESTDKLEMQSKCHKSVWCFV